MCIESQIDYEAYTITEDGRVFTKYYNKYLTGSLGNDGYIKIKLKCKNGDRKSFRLNRVIWYYFNGDIPDGYVINHNDECKTNNILSNLSLMTVAENNAWGTRNQRIAATNRKYIIHQIDTKTGEVLNEWHSLSEIRKQLGFSQASISTACNGIHRTAHKFMWRYVY